MKRKMLTALTALALIAVSVFGLTGCGEEKVVSPLKMETKYIYEDYIGGGKDDTGYNFFTFYSNGTGEYSSRYVYEHEKWDSDTYEYKTVTDINEYVLTFKYTYLDKEKEAIACFFDSIEYGKDDTLKIVETDWSMMFTVSENVLMTSRGYFYVNENYVNKELQNYNKKDAETENKDNA